jgi:Fe-Mn family superoxide dismutase
MEKLSRRDLLTQAAAAGTGLALAGVAGGENSAASAAEGLVRAQPAQPTQSARAFRGQHQPKPLPFDPSKLRGLSEKLIRSHWENNYGGAVKALNAVEQRLDALLKEKDLPAYIYGDHKREELLRTGSVVLHEYYFGNLGGDGRPGGGVADSVKQWFGSVEQWEAEFVRTANSLSGGSGWAVLNYNPHTGELHNYWAWDHMHNAPAGLPLLVLDMYEHAYHMDYGAAAAKYVEAFMRNVNWQEVDARWRAATQLSRPAGS